MKTWLCLCLFHNRENLGLNFLTLLVLFVGEADGITNKRDASWVLFTLHSALTIPNLFRSSRKTLRLSTRPCWYCLQALSGGSNLTLPKNKSSFILLVGEPTLNTPRATPTKAKAEVLVTENIEMEVIKN